MVKHLALPLLLLALVLSPACNRKSTPATAAWKPTALPAFNPQLPPAGPDAFILADMVTSVLLNDQKTQNLGQVVPVNEDAIPMHPQFGPFLFSSGNILIVVADSENRFFKWSGNLKPGQYAEAWFIALIPVPAGEQIVLSNEVKKTQIPARPANSIPAQNGKIMLTPENMAAALSTFSQWEGVDLDREKGVLTFVGSDTDNSPQISAGDLITAYRAIYEHEAFGEPLFVDMDFNDKQKDYLVTFGGGFEDTNPGRVLYESDLLLKGLSSGIDPFSNEKPLIELMCGSSSQNSFQKVLCKYILPTLQSSNQKNFTDLIKKDAANYFKNREMGKQIISLSTEAEQKNEAWEYVFFASKEKQEEILSEISAKGYFTYPVRSKEMEEIKERVENLTPLQRIMVMKEMQKLGLSLDMPTGCGCVRKPWIDELHDCAKDCDGESTKERVEDINDLTEEQKSIVLEARHFTSLTEQEKEMYSTLAFCSPKIHAFLKKATLPELTKLFSIMKEMEANLQTGEHEALLSNLAMLYFMSENTGFLQEYLKLAKYEQVVLSYLTSGMMLDIGFAKMLYNLQFHQPLCAAEGKSGKPTKVKDFNSAYTTFVCDYLSRYKRSYLADLIRKDFKGYQSAAEIGGEKEWPSGDSMITVRYWFFPGNKVLTLGGADKLNTFLFNQPNMKAQAERMGRRKGPFEDVDHSLNIPGVEENIEMINEHYDELAQMFPPLKELSNLVRVLAFFRWVRYYQSDVFDLGAFAKATDFGTPTPRTYPVYETVVALPNGSLMRAVGGVDMHSATQVDFNSGKIARFVAAKTLAGGSPTFTADTKKYVLAAGIIRSASPRAQTQAKVTRFDNQEVKVSKNGASVTFSHSTVGRLDWSWSSEPCGSGQNKSVVNVYKSGKSHRSVWQTGDKNTQNCTFIQAEAATNCQKSQGSSLKHLEQLKTNLTELAEANAHGEILWLLFSIPFKDAKMIAKNREHLYLFKTSPKHGDHYWLGARGQSGRYALNEIQEATARQWLAQPPGTPEKSASTKMAGLQLRSIVPTDSLIMTETGFRDDSLLNVDILGSRRYGKSLPEWRRMTTDSAVPTPWDKDSEPSIVLVPGVFERKKGDFSSNDLTSRDFLIESSANLRGKSDARTRHFAVLRNLPDELQPSPQPLGTYEQRCFIVDLLGFNPENQKRLLEFANRHADKVLIFSPEKKMPAALQGAQPVETIWLSALREREIRSRLENAQAKGWLNTTHRIRVFNANNPVFDLGNNLFVDLVQLRAVGAWPRVLNFDSLLSLIEKIAQAPAGKELDAQIAELVHGIQRDCRANPTPQRLQIARDLEGVLYSWEELRPLDQANLNWKNY